MKKLSSSYIKTATFKKTITIQEPKALKNTLNDIPYTKTSSNDRQEEECLEYEAECMEKATDHGLGLSCSTFNVNKTVSPTTNPDTTAIMLMFCEDSKLAAMIKDSMDMIWKAVNHLGKGQPIVVALG